MTTFKTLALALATACATLFLVQSKAEAKAAPEDFEGRFKLVSNRLGLCEPTILVLALGVERQDLVVMRWRFIRINDGKVNFDNDFEKGYSESYTTDQNTIVRKWRAYDKIKHANNREDTVASISSSGRLRIHSVTRGVFDFETDCSYQRTGDVGDFPDENPGEDPGPSTGR